MPVSANCLHLPRHMYHVNSYMIVQSYYYVAVHTTVYTSCVFELYIAFINRYNYIKPVGTPLWYVVLVSYRAREGPTRDSNHRHRGEKGLAHSGEQRLLLWAAALGRAGCSADLLARPMASNGRRGSMMQGRRGSVTAAIELPTSGAPANRKSVSMDVPTGGGSKSPPGAKACASARAHPAR